MNKQITRIIAFVFLLTGMAILPASAWDVKVAGQEVSTTGQVRGSGISGNVYYNASTRVLTLNGATINPTTGIACIETNVPLTISLLEQNTLRGSSAGDVGISFHADLFLQSEPTPTGVGSLTVEHCVAGFWQEGDGHRLSIADCTVSIEMSNAAGSCFRSGGNAFPIDITNATVNAEASGPVMIQVSKLTLNRCDIFEPSNMCFRKVYQGIADDRGNMATSLAISPIAEEDYYGVTILGHELHKYNMKSLCADGLHGTISFDPSTEKLTLWEGSIIGSDYEGSAIDISRENLTIEARRGFEIYGNERDVAINSPNKLVFTTSSGTPVPGEKADLNIFNGNADGIKVGLNGSLVFSNAKVETTSITSYMGRKPSNNLLFGGEGTVVAAHRIEGIRSVYISGADGIIIAFPLGAQYDGEKYTMVDREGKAITDGVIVASCEVYPVFFGEERINSWVVDDLIGDGLGAARYVPKSKDEGTIYLKNANFTNKGTLGCAIYNTGLGQLTVNVEGNNTLGGRIAGIALTMDDNRESTLNIQGGGTLNIESDNDGIRGYGPSSLSINNVTVDITSKEYPIAGFTSLSLAGCAFSEPANAQYNSAIKKVVDQDGYTLLNTHVVISQGESYGFSVADVGVNTLNANDILGDGTAYFTPEDGFLHLKGVNDTDNDYGIAVSTNSLLRSITVEGENTLGGKTAGLLAAKSLSITGRGTLNLSSNTVGIRMRNNSGDCHLRIETPWVMQDGPVVNITSKKYGILGFAQDSSNKYELTLDKATMTINAEDVVMGGLSKATFTGSDYYITYPNGAYFDEDKMALCYADGTKVEGDRFAFGKITDYGIDVAGIRVHSGNCDNIMGPGISGKVSYDPKTNTLTLDNARIVYDWAICGYDKENMGFTLKLIGENYVDGGEWYGLSVSHTWNTTSAIVGPGSLTITSKNQPAIYFYNRPINISDCTIAASSESTFAISTYGNQAVNIANANVTAWSLQGGMGDISGLTLKECEMIAPEAGTYSKEKGGIVDNTTGELAELVCVIKSKLVGDVNGDSKVNVGDIMAVINVMAANTYDADADVNGDGDVNVGDIMAIINKMAEQ
jgi:hypothetical protein